MSKKSYMSLLKEAITEFDTSDTVDVKGPMLDPIISWDGDGELPIYKDAASILERYYFDEDKEEGVETLDEADYENDKGSAGGPAMKSAHGTGTDQAGTSDSDTIDGAKKEREEEIAKEQEEVDKDKEGEEEVEEMEFNDKDVPKGKEYTDESADLEMENAIIEKLIAEMEDEKDDEDPEKEVEESEVINYTGSGPKEEAPKEKPAKGPEDDAQGAGTQQAGTGPDEGEIPPRKDIHDDLVKPKKYTDESAQIDEALAQLEKELLEQDDDEESAPKGDEGGDEEDKELDIDKQMKKEDTVPSAVPGGPSPKGKGEDSEDDEEAYSEAFKLFKEQIDDDDKDDKDDKGVEDIDSDEIKV